MPQNRKGAPARPFRPSASDAGARKPGSKSAKHRGHRPGEATPPTGAAKKPRWSSDERSDRGRPAERPRGDRAPERDARPARDGGYPRLTPAARRRAARDRDERPSAFRRDERPARTERSGGHGGNERAADGRPTGSPATRTLARSAPTTAPRARYDRPKTDRPIRDHHGERPTRQLRERAEHYVERPSRGYNDGAARHNDDRAGRHPVRRIGDDVVLERLEAQAVEAAEVDGIGFRDLGLGDNIVRVLAELGAETPFPIQAATIPDVLAGRDVLGRGRTGSGKTIAFGAPLVERLLAAARRPDAQPATRVRPRAPGPHPGPDPRAGPADRPHGPADRAQRRPLHHADLRRRALRPPARRSAARGRHHHRNPRSRAGPGQPGQARPLQGHHHRARRGRPHGGAGLPRAGAGHPEPHPGRRPEAAVLGHARPRCRRHRRAVPGRARGLRGRRRGSGRVRRSSTWCCSWISATSSRC